ncbi:hypothetical protein [Nocardia aurantiaca]|uniref:DUF4149 domain-containing protein n=1 Tax=Nocardia aurantiaca TaxID=2675850 RepID=A0A6I3KWB4_9NOCA|nr:hypothetical protein [Nocardia aurantiaca]MTE14302.1 hypothetical protein [Nocardia aurantiaca]
MTTARAFLTAAVFLWLGMVLAISFIEAPLKFRAPNVTLAIGLGIGRLVFRALNGVESLLAVLVLAAVWADPPGAVATVALALAVGALVVQLVFVRPRLTRRSDAVLAGEVGPRSRAHYGYVALEVLKALALLATGVLVLTAAVP